MQYYDRDVITSTKCRMADNMKMVLSISQ